MKKILGLIVLIAGVISFTSCDDNDSMNPYAHESVIQIVKADDLTFTSPGGASYIEFTAPANTQITCNADWVTLTPQTESRMGVVVAPNNDKSDRSAQVTFAYGMDKVVVTVHQLGFVLRVDAPESVALGNSASTNTFAIAHSGEVTVESNVDWITAYVEGDNLVYEVAANTNRVCRRGIVSYSSAAYEGSFEVLQGDIKAMVGRSFLIGGYDLLAEPEEGESEEEFDPYGIMMLASITSATEAEISLPAYGISGLKAKVKLDATDLSVNISCGGMGKLTRTLFGYLCAYDLSAGKISTDTSISFKFPMNYYEEEGFSGHFSSLDSQTFDAFTADAMIIYLFRDDAYQNASGMFSAFADVYMEEYTGSLDEEEARENAIKRAKSNMMARRTLGRR